MGGFQLPFLVVGALSTILSVMLIFTIPRFDDDEEAEGLTEGQTPERAQLR